jgi:hypothetical protein
MAFRATRTVVSLEPTEMLQLQEILMDDDKEQALAFLRDVIGEKIRCAQDESHKPEFEGGIRLQEVHKLSKGPTHPADESESG